MSLADELSGSLVQGVHLHVRPFSAALTISLVTLYL